MVDNNTQGVAEDEGIISSLGHVSLNVRFRLMRVRVTDKDERRCHGSATGCPSRGTVSPAPIPMRAQFLIVPQSAT